MQSAEKVSTEVRDRMDETPNEVVQAANVLENILLSEVSDMTKERLYDVQRASEKAETLLNVTKELTAIEETVRKKLYKGIADEVTSNINDSEKAGTDAFWYVDQQHENILNAIGEVKKQLMFTIANDVMHQMADKNHVAEESRAFIPGTSAQITGATSRLYEILVEDIAHQTIGLLQDSDEVIKDAYNHVDGNHQVISSVRSIVQKHMTESLLSNALSNIGNFVAQMDEGSEKSFFQNALQQVQGSPGQNPSPGISTETSYASPKAASMVENMFTEEAPTSVSPDSVKREASLEDESPAGAPMDEDAWSTLSELNEEAIEQEADDSSSKSWTVSEFRPTENDSEASARSGDGLLGKAPKPSLPVSKTLYVYGVVSTGSVQKEEFNGIEGITDGSDIKLLSCGELTAIVSEVLDPAFAPDAINESMRETTWLRSHVRAHADVLAEAQSVLTVIPLRFGCVFNSAKEIASFVEERNESLMEAISRLRNRSEFSVRVALDEDRVAEDGSGFGADDYDEIATGIYESLAEMAGESIRAADYSDDLILNATYLVPVSSEGAFKTEARKLSAAYDAYGISVEVTGPWPPYHFVDIDKDGSSSETEIPV